MSNVIDTVNMGYFIYDDVDTRDYDVQVYFKSVDSTPKRVGSFVSIPSRNGAFFVDEGRYEDMPHSYDIIALDPEEGKNIINAIARKTGHHRLEDSFNQDEFYQAIFVSAVEVRTETDRQYLKYALTFTRKPQRFLKSGETPVSVTSGDTLTNPTLFDAHPLLKFNAGGNGTINIGDDVITVLNAEVGNVDLSLSKTDVDTTTDRLTINNRSAYMTGNPITLKGVSLNVRYTSSGSAQRSVTTSNENGLNASGSVGGSFFVLVLNATDTVFTAGTSATVTKTVDVTVTTRVYPSSEDVQTKTFDVTITYNGTNRITISWSVKSYTNYTVREINKYNGYSATADSSKPTVSGDIYIDLDIGEAYGIDGDSAVSLNNYVNIGGELPALPLGNTTITYSNTISNFKVTPRWWKV